PLPPLPPLQQLASLSPNQIVDMRGLWDDPDSAATARATNALSVSSARRLPARNEATASIGPFPTHDRVPADVALAYAAQNDGRNTTPAAAPAVVKTRGLTSVANKPSVVAKSHSKAVEERLDDPWLRGLVLASNVQNSLVVTQVGEPDFTSFTQFMIK